MKFLHSFFESTFNEGTTITTFIDWLDKTSDHHNWLIIGVLTKLLFFIILFPIIICWLLALNIEIILTKIIFRYSIKIPTPFNIEKWTVEIKPWLEESLPYFKWNYVQADYNTPIIFRNKLYKEELIDIRFLTKEEQVLFELAWRGNVTFLKNGRYYKI